MEYNLPIINLTKELIEKSVSQEQLIGTYYGEPVRKGLFRAKHRSDNTPTCAYYWSKNGRLVVKDFGSDYSGDWIYVLMNKEHCSYIEALKIAANDFGILKDPSFKRKEIKIIEPVESLPEKTQAIINVEIRDFQDYELKWWRSFGITKSTLEKFNVFSCKSVFLNGHLMTINDRNHCYGYYGGSRQGIETWKIYQPTRHRYKWLSNWKSTQIQGARQLPKDGGDLLIIQKSLKDVMLLYEFGISAVAPNSENVFLTKEMIDKLKSKFKRIVVWFDSDIAGVRGLKRVRKQFPELEMFLIPRDYKTKDFSDFYRKYGKEAAQELLNKYILNGKEITSKSTTTTEN